MLNYLFLAAAGCKTYSQTSAPDLILMNGRVSCLFRTHRLPPWPPGIGASKSAETKDLVVSMKDAIELVFFRWEPAVWSLLACQQFLRKFEDGVRALFCLAG